MLEWCKLFVWPLSIWLVWLWVTLVPFVLLLFVVATIWLSAVWLKFNVATLLPIAVDAVVDVDIFDDNTADDGVCVWVNDELLLLNRWPLFDKLFAVIIDELTEDDVSVVGMTWKWIELFDSMSLIAELQLPITNITKNYEYYKYYEYWHFQADFIHIYVPLLLVSWCIVVALFGFVISVSWSRPRRSTHREYSWKFNSNVIELLLRKTL